MDIAAATNPATHPHKILVVDDEPDLEVLVRQQFRKAIRAGEFEFFFASNGFEALERLRQNEGIDVILTDINMPQMDGLTFLGELKNFNKQEQRVAKAVVVSAYGDLDNIRTAMNRGAFDFLVKPIDFQDVEITIAKTLEHVQEVRDGHRAEEFRIAKAVAEANFAQLQELELMRDSLVHMIVHDLRTPLTGIITGMQSLSFVGELDEFQREFLEIASTSAEVLLNMINDLLNISKMENGSMEVSYRDIEVEVLAQRALGQINSLAKGRNHQVLAELVPGLPALRADEELLCRVLVNLMGNAIKFTPDGGTIELKVQSDAESGGFIFSIKDSGHGIPEDHVERVFDKFAQVKGTSGTRTSTGLGLTFCKMAVEAHAGKIWVESTLGQGSTFHFVLPPNAA